MATEFDIENIMALTHSYSATIRVFKWDVTLTSQEPPSSSSSWAGVFLIRVNTLFPTPTVQEFQHYYWKLEFLLDFGETKNLLRWMLKRHPRFLRVSENFDRLVSDLAADLLYKFRFTSEFLSGQATKLVIFIDLSILTKTLNKNDLSLVGFFGAEHGDNKILGKDFSGEQIVKTINFGKTEKIEDFLKSRLKINAGDSKGMVEVKAAFELKLFGKNDEISNGSEGDSQEDLCMICLETLAQDVGVVEMACSHIFHKICAFEWLFRTNSCPLCRSTFWLRY